MSLSSALNIARSGLGVTALQADLVSRNIAKADADGHTRKAAQITTGPTGEVRVSAIDRSVDNLLIRLDRSNASALSAKTTIAEGIKAYTDFLGQPSDETSPTAKLSALNTALATLSGVPGEQASQLAVVSAARGMAENLNTLSGVLGDVSDEVEYNIRYDVSSVNDALQRISALNTKILNTDKGSAKMGEHRDALDALIDTVTEFMDVQTVATADGAVNLYTGGGTELVVGDTVHDLSYNAVSGSLFAGKVDITPGRQTRGISHGALSGLFELKTRVLPSFTAQLDSMAGALVQGFEAANPFGAGGTGLFTDAGAGFDGSATKGLAGRISLNEAVDPQSGGSTALLQSGGVATTPAGDASFVFAMIDTFDAPVSVDTAGLGAALSLVDLGATLVSSQQGARATMQSDVAATRAAGDTIAASRANFQGVNIDDEMQKLLLIEQSYKANAKVLTSVSEMLDTLLAAV